MDRPASTPPAQDAGPDYKGEPATDLFAACIRDATDNWAAKERGRANLRALMFYRGGSDNFWTVWNPSTQQYDRRPYDDSDEGLPAWIPRAATNVFANKIDGIASVLNRSEPARTWRGATDEDSDQAAAEVAEKALPVLLDEIRYESIKERANLLLTLTDKVAVIYYFDTDPAHGMGELPVLGCIQCDIAMDAAEAEDAGGVCPECKKPLETIPDPKDPSRELTIPTPKGRMCAQLLSAFEFSIPTSAPVADEELVPWVLTHARMAKEDVLRVWGDVPNIESLVADHKNDGRLSGAHKQFAEQMRRMAAPLTDRRAAGGTDDHDGPVIYRLYHDPTKDFPEGFEGVMLGDQVLEGGPLTVKDFEGRPKKPVILRTYRHGPGSPHGKPPADDLVPLQEQRCLVETLMLLIWMHDSAPTTFLPLSITLEDEMTGRPGEVVRFRSMVPGEVPVRSPGINPPESLFRGLELIDEQFDRLSNLNAILQGSRPEGDPTLGEVERLQEQGMASFSGPLGQLTQFELRQARMLLWIARDSMWSPRFWRIAGENAGWDVQQFTGADLSGNIDITSDPASAWPRSPLAIQSRLKLALEMGVIMPAQDPELAEKLLELLGLIEFKPSLDIDRKQIARALDKWKAAHMPEEIVPPKPTDNLAMHAHYKAAFLKTEEFEQLEGANPPLAMAMVDHVLLLQMTLAQQQAAAAAGPDAGGTPDGKDAKGAPGGKGKASAPPDESAQGGMGDLLSSGVLSPVATPEAQAATAQQQAVSVDDLIAAHVLTPLAPEAAGGP